MIQCTDVVVVVVYIGFSGDSAIHAAVDAAIDAAVKNVVAVDADATKENAMKLAIDAHAVAIRTVKAGLAHVVTITPIKKIEVESGQRIPLTCLKSDVTQLISLHYDTIQFHRLGQYKIDFIINTFTVLPQVQSHIRIGLKEVGNEEPLIHCGMRISTQANQLSGTGILLVTDLAARYELVNLDVHPLRLVSHQCEKADAKCTIVSMTIAFVGA